MAEQLVNEFTVNLPIDEAWAVITDVERIAPCLPGAQLQEIEDDVYRGVVKIKLGSIAPQFKGQANFVQRDDDEHRAVLKAEGRDTGGRGNASAEIEARAESLSSSSTRVVVTTDLHITGKVAQFGRGIIGDVSKKLMAQFAKNLNTMLDEQPTSATADEPDAHASSPEPVAPVEHTAIPEPPAGDASSSEPASHNGPAPAAAGDAPGGGTTTAAARPIGEAATPEVHPTGSDEAATGAPRIRKIDSPASEPVDLAGVAGPAVLKRLAPVVAIVLIVLFFVRRRR